MWCAPLRATCEIPQAEFGQKGKRGSLWKRPRSHGQSADANLAVPGRCTAGAPSALYAHRPPAVAETLTAHGHLRPAPLCDRATLSKIQLPPI